MLPIEKEILHSIKKLRKEKKILSKTMAHKLGIRAENYSRLESGKLKLDLAMLCNIAQVLDVNFNVFIKETYQRTQQKSTTQENIHFKVSPLQKVSTLPYDVRKNFKGNVVYFPSPYYFRSDKVYVERAIIEKLQQTIVTLQKVVDTQAVMIQGQQQIILSQEEEKKQLWKLIDQIEGLQLITLQKKA